MRICIDGLKLLAFICVPLLVHAADLADVQVSESEFSVSSESVAAGDIYLNTTAAGASQSFDQSGGSVLAEQLRIDDGAYQMSGGELNVSRIALGDPTTDRIQAVSVGQLLLTTDEPVSLSRLDLQSPAGLLTPVPSDNASPFDELSSNTSSRITFETTSDPVLLDGTLEMDVGYSGFTPGDLMVTIGDPSDRVLQSEFSQTGGTVHVRGNLELCVPTLSPITFIDSSRGVYEKMRYDLSDGQLVVEGDVVVGSLGAAPTTYSQTGGVSQIKGDLRVDGLNSIVELAGGTMDVGSLVIPNEGGLLMSPTASLVVRNSLVFGSRATFATTGENDNEGATIRLDGADLSFRNEVESLTDMRGVNIIAEGAPNEISTIEAFYVDMGDAAFEQIELGSLQIGGEAPAQARLENQFFNEWVNVNAIYVDKLVVSPGSTLDLNRINLYYDELQLGEGAKILNYSANCSLDEDYPVLSPSDLTCLRPENRDYLLEELGIQAGDLNADGQVDFTDFLVISENFGKTVDGYQHGDIDMDGTVRFTDFLQLAGNWATTGTQWEFDYSWRIIDSEQRTAASVPEPTGAAYALCVVILSTCGLLRRRRRPLRE